MSRLLGSFNQNVRTFASWKATTAGPVKAICFLNCAFFGIYQLSSGPKQQWLKRMLTLQPASGVQSLLTFHLCPTTWLGFLGTVGTMATLGRYHAMSFGIQRFMILYGLGVVGSATATMLSLRSDASITASGGWGAASAFIAFNLMKNP